MRPLLLAAAAGAVAGSLLLYGNMGGLVHDTDSDADVIAASSSPSCELNEATNAALDALITGDVAAVQLADTPEYMGDLSFKTAEGGDVSIADFKGKAILLNVWATWCAPCRAEMPSLSNLQNELGGNDFEVIAVNIDTRGLERPASFLEEISVDNLALYNDPSTDIFNELKKKGLAFGMPATLMLDKDGCRIAHLSGPAHWDSDDAKALVRATLETPTS